MKKVGVIWPTLILVVLLIGLSGCGANAEAQPVEGSGNKPQPDRVRIEIENNVDPAREPAVLMLTVASLSRQLYTTALMLPTLPEHQVCTMEMGPSYTLKFLQGDRTLATVHARRYGCRVVQIVGEQQQRQANQPFWTRLDQAISQATPPTGRS